MELTNIKFQLIKWLSRRAPNGFAREVADFPVAVASDIGSKRSENQDRVAVLKAQVSKTKSFMIAVLCDGMGGMEQGSKCATSAVATFLSSCIKNRNAPLRERLIKATQEANEDIYTLYQGNGGATLSAVIIDSDQNLAAINVGDSRIYHVHQNELIQVSVDDTIAARLGRNRDDDHLGGKLIQYIGMGPDLELETLSIDHLLSSSRIILTSDGIHYIEQNTLGSLAKQNITPVELCRRLVHVAKWCGGHDNLSAIVISEITTLFNEVNDSYSGTIQIWDHFGEVFLLGVEKSNPTNEPDEITTSFPDTPLSENPTTEYVKETETRPKRRRKPKSLDESKTKKKPQLRIDFDDK
ncbi:PP2C family protein-serine/threonine phosphatase [Rheinheimera sp. NSM]|uniref:PP2C family protein-serine/threonine phosphatase n=1 Tax=Rheinheimera sp. NSM TaxID=3457884 RepID=UPI0040367172